MNAPRILVVSKPKKPVSYFVSATVTATATAPPAPAAAAPTPLVLKS